MWSHLPIRSLIDLQRHAAIKKAGAEIAMLHREGYYVDRDRLLDELGERIQAWREEKAA